MDIDIRTNLPAVSRWLDEAQKKQLPFATALAMTMTAQDVREVEVAVMKRIFNAPTPYTLNALRIVPATKRTLVASVEFKDFGGTPAKRYLNPHVLGGPRSLKAHERQLAPYMRGFRATVPGQGASLDAHGNIPGSVYTRILSHLKVSSDPYQNITGSKRSRAKRRNSQYFAAPAGTGLRAGVYERRGRGIKPVLIFVNTPRYRKRFPFYEMGTEAVRRRFPVNFEIAFQRAMATARTPR